MCTTRTVGFTRRSISRKDAWVTAFTPNDDVTLVLKTWSTRGLSYAAIEAEIVAHFTSRGIDPERTPDIVLVADLLDDRGLAGLYAACDVYVAASRGESAAATIIA